MTKEEIIEEIIATNCDLESMSRLMKLIESSKNVKELEIAFEYDNFLSLEEGEY